MHKSGGSHTIIPTNKRFSASTEEKNQWVGVGVGGIEHANKPQACAKKKKALQKTDSYSIFATFTSCFFFLPLHPNCLMFQERKSSWIPIRVSKPIR